MTQFDENPEVQEAGASKASTVDYISGAKIVEGITTSVTDFTENLSKGITNVDNVMQSFVNQMGQGKGLAEGIRREYAGAAEEIIKLGGSQKEAAEIQTKTLEVLGRNVLLSKEQSKELFAATKISGVEIERLERGFINSGKSLKDIGKEMLMVREVANNMGVNAKAVSGLVVDNLGKLNRFGFQNGVEGLAKMAASSQGLGVNMEETLDFADGLMSPERAVEMAAFYQRMGVASESLKNPLKLIDMTYNNVEGLQDALGEAYSQFTTFNKDTGQFEIAKDARNKIKQIQQETGQSREYIEKMALSYANMKKKMNEISFSGFDVDEDTKKLIANVAEMDAGGEYKVKVKQEQDGKEVLVVKSIQELLTQTQGNKDELKKLLGSEEPESKKTIEQIAQEQLSYSQNIDANIKLLVEQPGLTAGASKGGEQLLRGTYEATKAVNEPFQKRLDSDSKIAEALDTFGTKIEEGITSLQEGRGYQDLLNAFQNQGAEFGKTVVTELTAGGIEVLANFGDLTGLSQLFSDLEITKDVKEILEKIKEEGGDFSDEAKKYFDDLLKEIEKNDEGGGLVTGPKSESGKKEEGGGLVTGPKSESGKKEEGGKLVTGPKSESGKKEEPDEVKAKETIEKLGNKAGELYDELKSSILDFFKEIVTDKIDVKELNILGGEKENAEKIEPIPVEKTLELKAAVEEINTTAEITKTEDVVKGIKPVELTKTEDVVKGIKPEDAVAEIKPTEVITPEAALPSVTAIAESEEGIIPPVEVVEPKMTVTPTPEVKPEIPKQTKEESTEDKGGFLGKIADKITGIGDVAQNIKGLATFDQGTITNLIAAAGKEIIPQLAEISKLGEKEQGAALQNLVKETLTPGKALKLLGTENEGVGEGGELDINAALSGAISENKELFQGEGAVDVKSITDMLEKNMGGIIDTAASTFKESGIAKLASKFLPKEMVGEEEGGLDKLVDEYAKTAKEMAKSTDLDSDLIAESISQAAEGKTVDFEQIAMGSYGSALMGQYEETPEVAEIEEVGTIEESITKAKEEKDKTESPEKVKTTLGEEISTLSVNELNVEKLNISTGLEGIVKSQETSVKNLSDGIKETTEQIATGQDKIVEGTETQTAVIESKEEVITPEAALPKEVKTETTITPEAALPSLTAIAETEEGIIPPVEEITPEDALPKEVKTETTITPEAALPTLTAIAEEEPAGIIPPIEAITPEAALPSLTAIAEAEEGIIPPVEVVEPKMTVTPTPEVLPETPKEKTEKPAEEKESIFGKLLDKVTNVSDIAKNVKGLASMDQGTITNLISAAGKDIIPKLSEISGIKDKKEQTSALQGLIKETMTPSKVMDLLKTENKGAGEGGEEFNLNTALSDAIGQNKELLEGTDVKGITEMLESNMGGIIDTAASTFKDSGIGKLASKFGFDVEGQVDEYANMAKDVAETSDLDSDLIAKAVSDAASGKEVDFEGIAMGSYQEAYAPEAYEPESIFTETEEPFTQIQEETPTLGGEIPAAEPFTEITEGGITEPVEIVQPTSEEEITKLGEEIKTLSVNELNVNNLKITSGLETIIQGQEDSINLLGENILDSNDTLIDNQDKLITEAETQTQTIESVNQEIPVEEVATKVVEEKIKPEAALPTLTAIAEAEEGIIPPVEAIKPEAALPTLTAIAEAEEGIIPPVEAIKPEVTPIAEVKSEIPKETEKEEKVGFFGKIGDKFMDKIGSIGNIAENVKGLATMDQGTITNLISAAGKDIIPKLSEIAGMEDEGKQSDALKDLVKTTLTPEKAIELLKTENKGDGEGGEFNLNEALTTAIGENKELLEGTDIEGITNMLEKNMGGIIDTAASTFKDSGIGKLASKFGFDVEGQVDQYAQMAKETAEATDLDAEGIASMVEKAAGGENVDFESAFTEGIYPEEEYYTEEPTYEEPVYGGIEPTTYENEVVNAAPVMEPTLAPLGIEAEPFDMAGINERVQQFLGQETINPRGGGEESTKGETVRIEAKITIDGDPRFASLLDPRKLQETIEGVMTKSIGKPQFAQKVSIGTERASMGLS